MSQMSTVGLYGRLMESVFSGLPLYSITDVRSTSRNENPQICKKNSCKVTAKTMAPTSSQNQRSSPRRVVPSGISPRPQAGSAYASSYSTENEARQAWDKIDVPGGKKLWCRLVSAFFTVAVLGTLFIILGAVYFKEAYEFELEHRMSLPLVWCIIGIVSGSLMVVGSIVLGRLIISSKWRKNQQPVYPSMARPTTVRYHASADPGLAHVEIDLPPTYEDSQSMQPPSVYIINAANVNLTVPPGSNVVGQPPAYVPLSIPKYTDIADLPLPEYELTNATVGSNVGADQGHTENQMQSVGEMTCIPDVIDSENTNNESTGE